MQTELGVIALVKYVDVAWSVPKSSESIYTRFDLTTQPMCVGLKTPRGTSGLPACPKALQQVLISGGALVLVFWIAALWLYGSFVYSGYITPHAPSSCSLSTACPTECTAWMSLSSTLTADLSVRSVETNLDRLFWKVRSHTLGFQVLHS